MRINDSCRGSKIFRALLILMLFALPAQSAIAQLTIRISNSSLGTVIKQIQSQSKYQFFYDDNLASMRIESLNVKDVSLVEVLMTMLFICRKQMHLLRQSRLNNNRK